ncbi:MAG: hypothetical protein RJA02_659, partial [Armatimonadota bacterium]
IWTDVVQAFIMFGSAIAAIFFLLNQIGGWSALTKAVPAMTRIDGYFVTGFETTGNLGFAGVIKHIFTGDYTIFSAVFGATMLNMAMFGTDQDMVQRMLTAETHQKAKCCDLYVHRNSALRLLPARPTLYAEVQCGYL